MDCEVRTRASLEKCCSTSVDLSADVLAVVVMAKQRLDLEGQVTKREQVLEEVERKLQVASCTALSIEHSAREIVEEARRCREELETIEGQLGIAQVAASTASDGTKAAKEKASKFEADYVAVVGRRRDEVHGWTKMLCEQAASAAAGSKELASRHARLESHKTKADFLDQALKVIRKEVAPRIFIGEKQRTQLDATGTKMTELKNHSDETSASTASCRQKLLHVLKNLASAPSKVEASLACAVEMAKERDAATTKYEDPRLTIEQRMGLANRESARLETKIFKVTQERDASVAEAEQLALRAHYVPGLAKESEKFCKRLSSLKTTARAKATKKKLIMGKKMKQKRADVEDEIAQARVELDGRKARVAELEARAAEMEKRPEQSASQLRVAEFKYLLFMMRLRR